MPANSIAGCCAGGTPLACPRLPGVEPDHPVTEPASDHEQPGVPWWRRPIMVRRLVGGALLLIALALILVAVFPVGWAKSRIERRMADAVGAPVTIGAMAREPFFSFSPTIVVRDVRIAQPRWAGPGDLARVQQVRLRVPLLRALVGQGLRPTAIEARGLAIALVRDATGRSNWQGRSKGDGNGLRLSDLTIADARFTLRDDKRHLRLAGTLVSDRESGLKIAAEGRFHDAAATVEMTGVPVIDFAADRAYPFALAFNSPLLDLRAKGSSRGALNFRAMTLDLRARAPSLKYLDDIIQAGLFGSQPIDLEAKARHAGRDWFVDRLGGRVGRSRFAGKATILKRDGRSKIDADLIFSQFDFDDLADAQGRAEAAALTARIGKRVLPNTRINLSKVGPTDGEIRFVARRLLFRNESAFRSLKGVIKLDHKLLTVEQVEAGLASGVMTGRMVVDHREGASPRLDMDLTFTDGQLGPLVGAPDKVDAPFRARIVLTGRGDTIREALRRADGHVGLAAANGRIVRTAAAILAQDMGKAIGAALGDRSETVPLNCVILGFDARGGQLRAAPFIIDTAISRSQGTGTINLDGEQIALTIGGRARDPSGLPLVDPITIGGTLSNPAVRLSEIGGKKGGGIFGAVAKSIGSALGLVDKKGPPVAATGPLDCPALAAHVLATR